MGVPSDENPVCNHSRWDWWQSSSKECVCCDLGLGLSTQNIAFSFCRARGDLLLSLTWSWKFQYELVADAGHSILAVGLVQTWPTRRLGFDFFRTPAHPVWSFEIMLGSKVQGKPAPWPEKVLWSEWVCPTAVRSAHIPYWSSPRQWHQYMQHLSLTHLFTRILNPKKNVSREPVRATPQ